VGGLRDLVPPMNHQSIGTGRAILYGVIAVALGWLRLSGQRSVAFQAVAHLYTGGFIGAAAMGWHHAVGGWKYYAGLAVCLSLLELVAFLAGIGR
jgi:hypothetical protein